MVKKSILTAIVLAFLLFSNYTLGLEVNIANSQIHADDFVYELKFNTDLNSFCIFSILPSTMQESLESIFNIEEEIQTYSSFEESQEPSKTHLILLEIDLCEQSAIESGISTNCKGKVICCTDDFDIDSNNLGTEISNKCNFKEITIIRDSTTPSPTPTIQSTPSPSPTQSPSPSPTPSPSPSPTLTATPQINQEQNPCVPDCNEKNCGDNGCGGSCGNCLQNQQCYKGVCISYGPSEVKIEENQIGANFLNNSNIKANEEIVFQTSKQSICYIKENNEILTLENKEGTIHLFPMSSLKTGNNSIELTCKSTSDSIENTKTFMFDIDEIKVEDNKENKPTQSKLILIVTIIASLLILSSLILIVVLLIPKKKNTHLESKEQINFSNNNIRQNPKAPLQTIQRSPQVKKAYIPKKHSSILFDDFSTRDNLSNKPSSISQKETLVKKTNEDYVELNDSDESKGYIELKYKEDPKQELEKELYDSDFKQKDEDPTKELINIILNQELSSTKKLTRTDIIDILRELDFKDRTKISKIFKIILEKKKASSDDINLVIQDLRKLNVIDEMQSLEILSESGLLNNND